MKTNVKLLGWLHIVIGALTLLIGLSLLLLIAGGGLLIGHRAVSAVAALIGVGIGGFLTLVAAPGIITGIGLLNRKPWSRVLALIIAFFYFFEFPFGTVLAIYTFVVLLQEEAALLFLKG